MPSNSNKSKRNNEIRQILLSSNTPLKDLKKIGLTKQQALRIINRSRKNL